MQRSGGQATRRLLKPLPVVVAPQGSLDEAAVERLKDDDAVSLLFAALSQQYPQVGRHQLPG